jgi:predicted amidohydrolase YtcJ
MHILFNANFPQLQSMFPDHRALAIDQGRILAIGSVEKMLGLSKSGDILEDLDGQFILPSLCDAHIHLLEYARSLSRVDCETSTRLECLQRVARQTGKVPSGQWLLGHGWDHNRWPEGFGNAHLLDEVSQQHPIYLTAKSLHAGWANSAALQAAGIQTETDDPENGRIVRDAGGKPTGILLESAMYLVERAIPQPSRAETRRDLAEAIKKLNGYGITCVHDFDTWDIFSILKEMDDEGQLSLRVVKGIPHASFDLAVQQGLRSGQRRGMLQIGWLKLFSDGALGAQSAAMLEPYQGSQENRGMLLLEAEQISEIGRTAIKAGIDLAVHAIGDRANRVVLDAFRAIRKMESRLNLTHRPHRSEHVQLITPADQRRMAELGIIASMQPIHVISDQDTADRYWGERCRNAYAWNSLLRNGASLIFGSDAPVETPNPFPALAAAISRRKPGMDASMPGWQPQECLTIEQAWQAYTSAPAYAAGWSQRSGKLDIGFDADLIVLDKNPFTASAAEVSGMRPARTMLAGEWVDE